MRSKGPPNRWDLSSRMNTSPMTMRDLDSKPTRRTFSRKTLAALRSFSTKTARAAPRLRASIPRAPDPANKSRTVPSGIRSPSMLNKASFTISPVGRVVVPGTEFNRIPRREPPTIRIRSHSAPCDGLLAPSPLYFLPQSHLVFRSAGRIGFHETRSPPVDEFQGGPIRVLPDGGQVRQTALPYS